MSVYVRLCTSISLLYESTARFIAGIKPGVEIDTGDYV